MRRWLYPSAYHSLVLFVGMGLCGSVVAWMSFGLISVTMANFDLLQTYGLRAALDGGLLQLVGIGVKGVIALLAFLGFKGAEVELIRRWRREDD